MLKPEAPMSMPTAIAMIMDLRLKFEACGNKLHTFYEKKRGNWGSIIKNSENDAFW